LGEGPQKPPSTRRTSGRHRLGRGYEVEDAQAGSTKRRGPVGPLHSFFRGLIFFLSCMLYTWGPSLIWWSILLCGKVTYLSGMVERVGMVERGLLSSPGGLISRTKLGNSKRQYAHMVITSWLNIFWLTCLCSSGDNRPSPSSLG